MKNKKVIIIGGVAGGASTAARLRRLDEKVEIIMLERSPYVSFANCGLPYHISGKIEKRSELLLQTPESFLNRFNVDVRVQNEVIEINKEDKTIRIMNTITKEEYSETYDKLVISTGSKPFVPDIKGLRNNLTHSLRNVPDMDSIISQIKENKPQKATVIGGGFIGLEMMESLQELGIETSLIELSDQVLTVIDKEMAGFLHEEIREKGVDLKLGVSLKEVEMITDKELNLKLSDNTELKTNLLITAIGVRPEVTLAIQAGLELGDFGGIKTNEYMETSFPDIYAVGDATESIDFVSNKKTFVPLADPANRQGRIAANNIANKGENKSRYNKTQGTSICKVFDYAAGSVGKNEIFLKNENIKYEKVYVHAASHASYYPNSAPIALKILFSTETRKILGAQAVGKDGIDKRIDVLAVAQRAGMTIDLLEDLELSYAPPFGSAKDVINQAAFVAMNILKGDLNPIHFSEIEKITDEQLLLDVRTIQEFENGAIEGAINIPVDELRLRMNELPKNKEIIVYCQVGLRGNVAYRQLVNNGFSAKNLIGGLKTYKYSKI